MSVAHLRHGLTSLKALLLAALLAVVPALAERPNADPWAQLPLYQDVMAQPLQAPYRAGMLADAYAAAIASPKELFRLTAKVAGLTGDQSATMDLQKIETALRAAPDPLAASLAWMARKVSRGSPWPPTLPDEAELPRPLRFELALVLSSIGRAHESLQRSLAQLPLSATPELLRRQALDGELLAFEEPDFRNLLPLVDRETLLTGMVDLVAAVERLQHFVVTTPELPAVAWSLDTPLGQIAIDTTGRNNTHRLKDPLLVLDVGGDDVYEFLPRSDSHRISVLLDHKGNDRYIAKSPGADPSAATLGYGILWDTQGDDRYEGTQHAQASALFGAALLVDGGGQNRFVANSHAQAHAIGGLALLIGGSGDDRYTAQTHAQGSAGPQGVAVLIDPAGNDQYTLDNTPLIRPSPQLPSRNTSMGQGAGRGLRADSADGPSTAGGIGILLDLAGNDTYVAQVFAQGAGYQEGLGMLIDNAGNDHFDAAWYAMGAGAHQGVGILLKRGNGNDHYRASHSMSIGAAHDYSVGIFLDEGGNDQYELGNLGLGAANDHSFALFVDAKGDDFYFIKAAACRALGVAQTSEPDAWQEDFVNLGVFMDMGGVDRYPAHCARAQNNRAWSTPQTESGWPGRFEAGAGIGGEFDLPFSVRAPTEPPARGFQR